MFLSCSTHASKKKISRLERKKDSPGELRPCFCVMYTEGSGSKERASCALPLLGIPLSFEWQSYLGERECSRAKKGNQILTIQRAQHTVESMTLPTYTTLRPYLPVRRNGSLTHGPLPLPFQSIRVAPNLEWLKRRRKGRGTTLGILREEDRKPSVYFDQNESILRRRRRNECLI